MADPEVIGMQGTKAMAHGALSRGLPRVTYLLVLISFLRNSAKI